MKPPAFEYFAPTSVEEARDLLGRHGDDAKLLAGGQSLVPLLNFRLVKPAVLIDLNRVPELSYIRHENGAGLRIGAMTRHRTVERDPTVRAVSPLLAEAIPYIGHFQIRNRGTVGGSIAHADPAAELPAILVALNGSVKVVGPNGDRVVPASDFFVTYLTTDLAPDELLTEIQIPPWRPGDGWALLEVSRRHGDFALVGVACRLTSDPEGVVTDVVAVLFGVGPTPVRANAVSHLVGTRAGERELAQVAAEIAEELEPDSDIHASAEYRKYVGGVLVRRAIATAYERARRVSDG